MTKKNTKAKSPPKTKVPVKNSKKIGAYSFTMKNIAVAWINSVNTGGRS
jgi:hypothetical protein